ncbi:type IV secretory system conjugative DNA transfer family protein [Roseospirillum parvum]|uniref:Type IV secretion system protein VirD4 n=1 Tax=Roseospirillum parvum TaxID=83401 RepID=A0A1G8G8F8_9PROT|nr:type IV secretory system conjugative DNA transfer family protein [Roseospirillum parvum]SDH90677.1 type IV secretion system protein VirD4 [Roseospirillum parvum]
MPFIYFILGSARATFRLSTFILIFAPKLVWKTLPLFLMLWGLWHFRESQSGALLMAALMCAVGMLIQKVGERLFGLIWQPPVSHGSARFATEAEARIGNLFTGRGVILGRLAGSILRFAREGHILTFAPTRSGKGAGGVIPNLLDHPGSCVVIDVKGENFAVTARERTKRGAVYALAPFATDFEPACVNPLDFIRLGTIHEAADAALIADLIVVPHGDDTYWDDEARNVIAALIFYVATDMPDHQRTLGHVADLATTDREGFDALMKAMGDHEHAEVRRRAHALTQKEERERSGVISSVQNHLAPWLSHKPLARACHRSDFRFEDLKDEVATVYLILPPEYLVVCRSFVRVMTGLAIAAMTRTTRRPKHRVLFLLDEVAALGYIKVLEEAIGYIAGYGVTLWLFFQDLAQLEKTYRKWRSIVANCAVRQAFNVADAQTAKELSTLLGVSTVKVDTQGRSASFPFSLLPHSVHRGMMQTARPLMTEDEVMALSGRKQLLFIQGMRPILASKLRYFDWWEWRFWGKWDRWQG